MNFIKFKSTNLYLTVLSMFTVMLYVSCETIDGIPIDNKSLNYSSCQTDSDCGIGRFCDPTTKSCYIECNTSKDCGYKYRFDSDKYDCSPCGRCIKAGEKDILCLEGKDVLCETSERCRDYFQSTKYTCYKGLCSYICNTDSDCASMGFGFTCHTQNKICYRGCSSDNDCYFYGWQYKCNIVYEPPLFKNEGQGECLPREGGVEWEREVNKEYASYDYRGIWAFVLNAAITIKNVPFINIQNVLMRSVLLVKIWQRAEDIELYNRWCSVEFINIYDEKDTAKDLVKMIVPERYPFYLPILKTVVKRPTELQKGGRFSNLPSTLVYGAQLSNPETGALPTRDVPNNQYDDDRDGKPGTTIYISGIINGEIHSAQRFWFVLNAVVIDNNRIGGLMDFKNELSYIGAEPEILYFQPIVEKYSNPDYSYFKALRVPDSSSCADILKLSKKDNWLKFNYKYIE